MAYKIWSEADISFAVDYDLTSHPVVTIAIKVPSGLIMVMGEPRERGRTLVVEGVHVSSRGVGSNDVGVRNLRLIADIIMKVMDYDDIRLEGEVRTTGAYPGHRPRPIRFVRDRDDPAGG